MVPFPATDGGRIRVLNLLKQIAKTEQITFLALETTGTDQAGIDYLTELGIECHLVPNSSYLPPITAQTVLRAAWQRKPITVARYDLPALARQFRHLLANGDRRSARYDLIHYEMFHAAQFAVKTDLPTVLSTQNVDSYIWRRLGQETKNPLKKAIYGSQTLAFAHYERVRSANFTAATCVSGTDQVLLQKARSDLPVHVIPNGVDLDLYQPDPSQERPETLIYTGSMDWYPNEDAVIFFLQSILPNIWRTYPQVRLSVVGQHPTEKLRRVVEETTASNTQGEVVVTGRVEDVKPYIAQAGVYVVPLRIGGGTRLKILEALAMQKAVVSTTVGAEGLNLVDRQEIVLADRPNQFADSVIELLSDSERRQNLGLKGRERVEQDYGWSSIGHKLRQVYQNLLQPKAQQAND